jgi:soluble lytic murein transglycosylase-like protein
MLKLVGSEHPHLPPCMTPQVLDADEGDSDTQLPEAWLKDKRRAKIVDLAQKLAPEFNVDPRLVLAVIGAESGFAPDAVSPKNAQGLMQLIPETAVRFKVKKILDPVENMRGGIAYLRWLLAYFKGDVQLVLAAYNAGEGAVERYRGIPPYAETQRYVDRVAKFYGKLVHRYDASIVQASPLVAARRPKLLQISALRD